MASGVVFRTKKLVLVLLFAVIHNSQQEHVDAPVLTSLQIGNVTTEGSWKIVQFNLSGEKLSQEIQIQPTKWFGTTGSQCQLDPEGKFEMTAKNISATNIQFELKINASEENILYFCARKKGAADWIHQGKNVTLILGESQELTHKWVF